MCDIMICKAPVKWGQNCIQCEQCSGIMLGVCTPTCTPVLLGFVVSVVNLSPALWAFNPCPTKSHLHVIPSVLEDTLLQDQDDDPGAPLATSSLTDTSSSFNHHQKPCRNNLKCAVINCNGLYDKIPQLETFIDFHKSDIIIGTESHLKANILTTEITPPGFATFCKDWLNIKKGGVFIMVKNDLIATQCNIVECEAAELLWSELHLQGRKPPITGSFYRPPKSPASNLQHLANSLEEIESQFKVTILIIGGDFNLANID